MKDATDHPTGAAASMKSAAAGSLQAEAPSLDSMRVNAAGQAYQAVAQSAAIAVQDAADNLRNLSTISTTAIGVAMAQYLATGDTKYAAAIDKCQQLNRDAVANFKAVGEAAAKLLKDFPSE